MCVSSKTLPDREYPQAFCHWDIKVNYYYMPGVTVHVWHISEHNWTRGQRRIPSCCYMCKLLSLKASVGYFHFYNKKQDIQNPARGSNGEQLTGGLLTQIKYESVNTCSMPEIIYRMELC